MRYKQTVHSFPFKALLVATLLLFTLNVQHKSKNTSHDVAETLDWGQHIRSLSSLVHTMLLKYTHTHVSRPTFGKILKLVAGLFLPPLPGFEQFSYWRQLASLLPWCRGILGIGGAVHHHVTAGQWWWFLQPFNWKTHIQEYKNITSKIRSHHDTNSKHKHALQFTVCTRWRFMSCDTLYRYMIQIIH